VGCGCGVSSVSIFFWGGLATRTTHPVGIDASDHGIPFIALTNRVVEHTQLLSNEMDNPPLLGSERPGERELVSHAIVLEEQNARIYFQSRRVVKI
jgi:hypothetical protein